MSHQLPDIQTSQPDVTVKLSQVGVTGVEELVKVVRDGKRPLVLMTGFEVLVGLPDSRKGIDMSRNVQVISEVLEAAVSEPTYRVGDMCGDAAERLFVKHEYTTTAEVSTTAELVVRKDTPTNDLSTQSAAEIITNATATDEDTREGIGTKVAGMIVCPCSQGMSASRARDVLQDLAVDGDTIGEFLDKIPQPGRSQRSHATLTVETQDSPEVDLMDLIGIARDSVSACIYNLAGRPDEGHVTHHTHADARLVEDCIHSMAKLSLEALGYLGDDAVVHMRQSNDESIRQHNAHAEREVTLGQLRDGLDA